MAAIRFLGVTRMRSVRAWHVTSASLRKLQGTGRVQLIANDEYFANKLAPYLGGESPADVYMSGPVLMWNSSAQICRATGPVSRTSRLEYDPDDFLATLVRAIAGTELWRATREGPLLELPVNCESYNLAYLPPFWSV